MLAGGYDERLRVQPRTEHPKKIRELWDKRGKACYNNYRLFLHKPTKVGWCYMMNPG